MKKLLVLLTLFVGLVAGGLYATAGGYPPLRNGDLIFQTSTSSQSAAILIATADPFTHMGIIKIDGDKVVVIEAGGVVKETPLAAWVRRGVFSRVAIYRDPDVSVEQASRILAAAREYYGRAYDIFFSLNNSEIYCSELPYLAYGKAGISIGEVQKISDLHFDNALVRKVIEQRWKRHSECVSKQYDFDQCYQHILDQDVVTPASIARDAKFVRIYSNYPL